MQLMEQREILRVCLVGERGRIESFYPGCRDGMTLFFRLVGRIKGKLAPGHPSTVTFATSH